MRILVVGAGAVGGYFGGRLVEARRDVTFLVRPKRAAELKAEGLQIVSPHGNLSLRPRIVTAAELDGFYDVVLLSVKSYTLTAAMDDFASAVGPQTMILPVLNGMRHMDLLAERFGKSAVLGGVCLVATEIDPQGRIRQLADFQALSYGELDGQLTPRIENLDQALRGAGFQTSASENILGEMWRKWVQLATLGSTNCLLRGDVGQVAGAPGGEATVLAILKECSEVAAACGYAQSEEFLNQQRTQFTTKDSRMTSSMYRDLQKGAPVEADTILGDLWERGRKLGLHTPLLQAAYVNLSIYQRTITQAQA